MLNVQFAQEAKHRVIEGNRLIQVSAMARILNHYLLDVGNFSRHIACGGMEWFISITDQNHRWHSNIRQALYQAVIKLCQHAARRSGEARSISMPRRTGAR